MRTKVSVSVFHETVMINIQAFKKKKKIIIVFEFLSVLISGVDSISVQVEVGWRLGTENQQGTGSCCSLF